MGPSALAIPTQGPRTPRPAPARTCQVDGDPAAEEAHGHVPEEAAVVEEPVRPGGGAGREGSGVELAGGGWGEKEGAAQLWGKQDLCEDPSWTLTHCSR